MVFVVVVAVLVVCVAAVAGRGTSGAPTRASRGLAISALVAAIFISVPVFFLAWDDSGLAFAAAVGGFPVLLTAGAIGASWNNGTPGALLGWLCLVLLVAYVLVFGLGPGLFFAPVAFLVLASMLARQDPRRGSQRP